MKSSDDLITIIDVEIIMVLGSSFFSFHHGNNFLWTVVNVVVGVWIQFTGNENLVT